MPDLPKKNLGRTGLSVTTLGFGALELRGMVAGVGRGRALSQRAGRAYSQSHSDRSFSTR